MIQLQGYASAPLSGLTFDVSNAEGILTNQTGYLTGQFFDSNLFLYTTNYFECPDVALSNGTNLVTLHAVDRAGNTANVSFTLNCSSSANPPALSVTWPQDGTYISASQFTFQGAVDKAGVTIMASIVDESGDTNTVQGLVEQNGTVWVKNLPLSAGANTLTVAATDAAGNTNTTQLTVYQSSVMVTLDPLPGDQLNQPSVNVTGTVSDPSCEVYVNTVQANVNPDDGTWEADGVAVNSVGTAIFDVEIYSGNSFAAIARAGLKSLIQPADAGNNPNTGSVQFSLPQPVLVALMSYSGSQNTKSWNPGSGQIQDSVNWLYNLGGTYDYHQTCVYTPTDWHENYTENEADIITPATNGVPGLFYDAPMDPPWEFASLNMAVDYFTYGFDGTWENKTQTRVMIEPGGQAAAGQTNVYLVRADAQEFSLPPVGYDFGYLMGSGIADLYVGDWPLPPEWLLINGKTLVDSGITNDDDGSVWGEAIVAGPTGVNVDMTPVATQVHQNWDYTFDAQALDVTHILAVDNNRDGQITFDYNDGTTTTKPFRFWINDSTEHGDDESAPGAAGADDQIPGQPALVSDGEDFYLYANYAQHHVNGRSDLVNFFPVAICLSNVMQWAPVTNGFEYHLSQADSAVKYVYTSLIPTNAFDYLTNLNSFGYGTNFNEWATNADTIQVLPSVRRGQFWTQTG